MFFRIEDSFTINIKTPKNIFLITEMIAKILIRRIVKSFRGFKTRVAIKVIGINRVDAI